MKIPSINLGRSKLPSALDMPSIPLEPPSADMPVFPPIVIPPTNLAAPKGVELEEVPEETEDAETATTEQPTLRAVLFIMIWAMIIAHSNWGIFFGERGSVLFASEQLFLILVGAYFAIKGNK